MTLPPLCRLCGKPIAKATVRHNFGCYSAAHYKWHIDHVEKPTSLAEAQRLTNGRIVAHRKYADGRVYMATTWDGESYVSPYFCKHECARAFGYFAMEYPGAQTKDYCDAKRARGE